MSNTDNLVLNLQDNPEDFPPYFKKIYDKNCIRKKRKYIIWIDKISKNYKSNIYWWSLAHVNKNNYINKTFHYFVLLETIKFLKNSHKFNTIIVDEKLKNNISKINFKTKKKIIFKKKDDKPFNLFQIIKFIIFNFLIINLLKINSKKKFYKSNLILIDCFIYNFKNPEFGFISNIKKNKNIKKNYFFIPTFAYMNYFKRLILILRLSNENNYMFKENFINVLDLLDLFKVLKFAYFYKKKIYNFNNWDFSNIIFLEMKNFSQFESIFHSILNYKFAKNLKEKKIDVHKTINYFENQNLDKGWNLGFNTFFEKKENIGYQAFNYLPESFNTSPSKQEFKQEICPKLIITKGEGFAKIISENCKKINFLVGPSFKNFDKKKFNSKKKINYLFLLTGIPEEDKKIIDQMFLFQENNDNQKIGIKPHPISTISKGSFDEMNDKKIKIFNGDISKFLKISDIVVSTGLSTSLIEALIYNCKIIMYSSSIFDKFFFKKLNIPSKSYLFIKHFKKKKKFKLFPLNSFEKIKIIDNYFSKLSQKNLKNLI